jgi:hypothetical protein
MSTSKSTTNEDVGVLGNTGNANVYDPERALLQSQIAQELNGPGALTGADVLNTGYGTQNNPYVPGADPKWMRSWSLSNPSGPNFTNPNGTTPNTTGPPGGNGTNPTSPTDPTGGGNGPGSPKIESAPAAPATGGGSLQDQINQFAQQRNLTPTQLSGMDFSNTAGPIGMTQDQANQMATRDYYANQISAAQGNKNEATTGGGSVSPWAYSGPNFTGGQQSPGFYSGSWSQAAQDPHGFFGDTNFQSDPAAYAKSQGYNIAAPTQQQLSSLQQGWNIAQGSPYTANSQAAPAATPPSATPTPQGSSTGGNMASSVPGGGAAPLPQGYSYDQSGNIVGPNGQILYSAGGGQPTTQSPPVSGDQAPGGAGPTGGFNPTESTNQTGEGTGTVPNDPNAYIGAPGPKGELGAAGPYRYDQWGGYGAPYQWGQGGITGNANAALGNAYAGYNQMYQNPISQQTRDAMTQETMNAANAQTAGAGEQIMRNAAATGNSAGEAAAMAQLGRDRAGIGEQAARQNVIAQDTLANQRQQAALQGMTGIGAGQQQAGSALMGLQANLSGGPVGSDQSLLTSTKLRQDTEGGAFSIA